MLDRIAKLALRALATASWLLSPVVFATESLDHAVQEDATIEQMLTSGSFVSTQGVDIDLLKTKMKDDLETIVGVFESSYAPREWKESYLNWDLEEAVQKTRDRIAVDNAISVKGFQKYVRDFFNDIEDYHVSVHFYSTERSALPITLKGAEGRYFIAAVQQQGIPPNLRGVFNVGDEVLQFDGRPVGEVVAEFRANEHRKSNEDTDMGMAEFLLTHRVGASGASVPRGPVSISVRDRSGKVRTAELSWNYTSEQIANNTKHLAPSKGWMWDESTSGEAPSHFARLMAERSLTCPTYSMMLEAAPEMVYNAGFIGDRKSFLPTLGLKMWEHHPQSTFDAYIYATPDGRNVGYIRIPSFMGNANKAMEFGQLLQLFEANTDALVIDQLHNPGGAIFYMYELLSMFADRPIAVPKHHVKVSQSEIEFALEGIQALSQARSDKDVQRVVGPSLQGLPVDLELGKRMLGYFQFIVSQWNSGQDLTDPIGLYGLDTIKPHAQVHYSKPVVVLIDHMSLSAGDFFPATLKDNNMATLIGSRTAGAGGFVLDTNYPNRFGIKKFSYTGSLAQRPNGAVIENLGIGPDVEYTPTADDLQNEYKGFVETIHSTVASAIAADGGSSRPRPQPQPQPQPKPQPPGPQYPGPGPQYPGPGPRYPGPGPQYPGPGPRYPGPGPQYPGPGPRYPGPGPQYPGPGPRYPGPGPQYPGPGPRQPGPGPRCPDSDLESKSTHE